MSAPDAWEGADTVIDESACPKCRRESCPGCEDTAQDDGQHGGSTNGTQPRSLILTRASQIKVRPVRWLWQDRLALGTLSLTAGREGIGKSIVTYQIAADTTRGRLEGEFFGRPKSVIVAATEDSWEHTIVPRLMAADADLDRVFRVEVTTHDHVHTSLSLPKDLPELTSKILANDVALTALDPMISRLDAKLDTHKDAEVRQALEPLVHMADTTNTVVSGLIHVSKATTTDPLTMVMGSRAFPAVARSVFFVMLDPDNEQTRLLGQPKNNLGRTDLPTLTFGIRNTHVCDTPEGPVYTGRLEWTGQRHQSISEAVVASGEGSATREAAAWLEDYLSSEGGTVDSASVKKEGRDAGHTERTLKRAAQRIRVKVSSHGYPRRTYWTLPANQATPGESGPIGPTEP